MNRKKLLQPSHPSQGGNFEKKKNFIYTNIINNNIHNNFSLQNPDFIIDKLESQMRNTQI